MFVYTTFANSTAVIHEIRRRLEKSINDKLDALKNDKANKNGSSTTNSCNARTKHNDNNESKVRGSAISALRDSCRLRPVPNNHTNLHRSYDGEFKTSGPPIVASTGLVYGTPSTTQKP